MSWFALASTSGTSGASLIVHEESPRIAGATAAPFLHRILVATDGSENGKRAVDFAIALAVRWGSDLEFCYAIDRTAALAESCSIADAGNSIMPVLTALDETAHAALSNARERAADSGLTTASTVLDGSPAGAIVDHQVARQADAIVVGTKGKSGLERLVMGSTADGVLRRAEVPVFVVPCHGEIAAIAFDRILVAIDDSDPSDAATEFAIRFAGSPKARLIFCGVAETHDLATQGALFAFDPAPMLAELRDSIETLVERAADGARERDVAAEWLVVDGEPEATIPSIARSRATSAIVIGTHGRRGLRRWLVGSVAEGVVQRSQVPVVVVRCSTPAR